MNPSSLYGMMNFSYSILLGILLFYANASTTIQKNLDKVYRNLVIWVICFCICDGFWGLFNAKTIIVGPVFFFIYSSLLHFANVLSAFAWINYYLAFLEYKCRYRILLKLFGYFLLIAEIICLSVNVFHPIIFSIDSETCNYVVEKYRYISLIMQYSGYVAIEFAAFYEVRKDSIKNRRKFIPIYVSTFAPLLLGIGKFSNANVPFNSTAYTFGCFIIHVFVSIREHEELNALINRELREVLTSMTDAYEVITLLNLDTGEEKLYRSHWSIKDETLSGKNFIPFEKRIEDFANTSLYKDDRELFINGLKIDNIWKNIQDNKVYKLKYRIEDDGKLLWFELRIVQNKATPFRGAVFGVRNITDEVMEEKRHQQILGSIAEIYLTMHLIDLKENRINKFYGNSSREEIINFTDTENADAQFKAVINQVILPEYAQKSLDFIDFTTLQSRLEGKKSISEEVVGKTKGWIRAQFVPVSYNSEGKLEQVMFTTQIIDEEKRHEESIILMSKTDGLTGIYNRRCFDEDLEEFKKEIPDNFFVVSADLNELKFANDNYGHSAGDELIIAAKDILTDVFGQFGKIYRTGGDEFIGLIVTDCSMEYLLSDFEKKIKAWKGKEIKKISISIGFAAKQENPELDIVQLCKLADEKMYADKAEYYVKNNIERRKR